MNDDNPGAVAVVGYASLDTTTTVASFRGVNATSILQRALITDDPGVGGIAHIVSAVVEAGAPAEAVSWVGPDSHGARWSNRVAQSGGGVTGVAVHGSRSPSATLIDIQAGGTICLFDPGDCHPAVITRDQRDLLETSDWVVLTVSPRSITEQVLESLPDSARLVWAVKHDDDAYTTDMIRRILERADVVSFSEGERPYVTIDGVEPERRVRPGTLVVETRGAGGVAWSLGSAEGAARPGSIAVDSVSAHDTTGAGDTFIGTLVALLAGGPHIHDLSDSDLTEAIARASTAAGDLLRRRTASGSMAGAPQKESH
jgi:ribokinase